MHLKVQVFLLPVERVNWSEIESRLHGADPLKDTGVTDRYSLMIKAAGRACSVLSRSPHPCKQEELMRPPANGCLSLSPGRGEGDLSEQPSEERGGGK